MSASSVLTIPTVTPTRVRNPADVAFAQSFVGRDLFTLLAAFKQRTPVNDRFRALVGSDYTAIVELVVVVPIVKLGESIVAEGCRPHNCGADRVIVVVDLITGTLNCGITTNGNMRFYSEDPANPPAPLSAWQKDPGEWNNSLVNANAQPGEWKR